MNLGMRGAALDLRHSLEKKGPIVPSGTIINPFKTDKTAANGNLG